MTRYQQDPAQPRDRAATVSPNRHCDQARTRRHVLGAGLAGVAGLAGGAWRLTSAQGTPAGTPVSQSPETREITTPLGTYEIPTQPRRVVAVDNRLDLEPAIALELPVIATSLDPPSPWVPAPPDLLVLESPIDIEAVLALDPDLIVCVNLNDEYWPAPTLNQIAPVITTEFEIHWRENLERLADWLGRTERLDQALAEYDAQVAAVQERHADALATKQVVYLQYYADDGNVYYNQPPFLQAQVLGDLGGQLYGGVTDTAISTELLIDLAGADGFLIQGDTQEALAEFLNSPIWQTLPAVQADHIVFTAGNTNYGSIYTAQELVRNFDELYTLMG